jgi:hypothetical protein
VIDLARAAGAVDDAAQDEWRCVSGAAYPLLQDLTGQARDSRRIGDLDDLHRCGVGLEAAPGAERG